MTAFEYVILYYKPHAARLDSLAVGVWLKADGKIEFLGDPILAHLQIQKFAKHPPESKSLRVAFQEFANISPSSQAPHQLAFDNANPPPSLISAIAEVLRPNTAGLIAGESVYGFGNLQQLRQYLWQEVLRKTSPVLSETYISATQLKQKLLDSVAQINPALVPKLKQPVQIKTGFANRTFRYPLSWQNHLTHVPLAVSLVKPSDTEVERVLYQWKGRLDQWTRQKENQAMGFDLILAFPAKYPHIKDAKSLLTAETERIKLYDTEEIGSYSQLIGEALQP